MAGVIEVMARLSGNSAGMVAAFAEGSRAAQTFATTAEGANTRAAASHEAASKTIRTAGLVTAAAIAGVSLIATDMAADFEKSTQRLVTSGGMTKATLEVVRDGILDISKSTGFTSDQLADGMFTVSAAGYNTAKGLDILKAAAQGAAAEGTDLSTMVDSLTSIMSVYHLKEDQVIGTTNQLVAASGLAKGTMQEFAGSLATVLPVASAAGITFADIGGAMAVMTNKGTSAQQATQELRNAITNLQAPNQVAVKQMAQLGINSQDVSAKLGERGLSGTMKYLSETVLGASEDGMVLLGTFKQSELAGKAMGEMLTGMDTDLRGLSSALMNGEMTTKDYNTALNKMDSNSSNMGHQFETLWKKSTGFSDALRSGTPAAQTYVQTMQKMMGGQTGLQVALQLTGGSMGKYEQDIKTITEAAGKNSDEVYTNADSQSTLAAQLARTKAEFGAMMIQLGTYLIPVFHDVLTVVTDTIHYFQEHETVAKVLGIALGGVAVFATGYAIAQWAVNSAMLAFPGTWIALAIIGLVAAFVYAYDNIGWFKDSVDTSFGEMKRFGEELAASWDVSTGLLADFFTDVSKNLSDFQTSSLKFADEVKANFQSFQDGAVKFTEETKGMFSDFNTNTGGMFDDFVKNTDEWNTQTQGMFDDFFTNVGEGWAGFWKDPIGETETFWRVTTDGFGVWSEETSKTITTWWDTTRTGFTSWNTDASKSLTDFIDSTKTGFQTWNEDLSRSITEWATGSSASVQTWNESTSKAISENHASTNVSFEDWNKTTSANLVGWATNQDGGFREWNRGTSGMVRDFATNTGGMIDDWGKNTNGMFETWKNNLTGKTRTFVDDSYGMLYDFNTNTIGMFTDFNTNTKGMFDDMFKHVGNGWKGLQDAAAGPVRFIVNTVYNDGIRKVWNAVNDGLGLGLALPEAHFATGGVVGRAPKKFATGGIMEGYSPGIDNHIIAVGGGEAIMRPEWTRAVGADKVNAMNSMAAAGNMAGIQNAMGGLQGFASGGIVGDILSNVGSFFANPLGGIQDALKPFTSMLSTTGGGNWGKMMNEFPKRVMSGLGEKIGGLVSAVNFGGGGAAGGPWAGGASGMGNPLPGQRISQWYSASHNGIDIAAPTGTPIGAAGPGRVSFSRWGLGGGGNEVHIDHPNGIQTWYAHLARPGIPVGTQVQGGSYVGPVGSTGNSTGPHLHFMTLNGGWPNHMDPRRLMAFAQGGMVPTFDQGGTLAPGLNLVNNATGAPEQLTNTTGSAGGMTIVLDIPELGGRLEARIRSVSQGTVGEAFGALTRAANSGRGTTQGVYVS